MFSKHQAFQLSIAYLNFKNIVKQNKKGWFSFFKFWCNGLFPGAFILYM